MILITGAAGFIGSALAWRLNQLGRKDLLLVDELGSDEKWKNLVPLSFSDYLETEEFLDLLAHEKLPRFEAVIHMGACSSTTEKDASYLVENNYRFSRRLAKWCLEKEIRYVYASSAATYGNGEKGYDDDHDGIQGLRPLNMYGYSKQMMDLWALGEGVLDRIVGLKFFNVYGPNEYHKGDMRSMVAKAYEQILSTGEIQLFESDLSQYGHGEQMRDFIYVKDAVDMTLHFLNPARPGGIYNIGTGEAVTWNRLMTALFRALGKEPKIRYVPMPDALKGKYQYFTQANIGKLRQSGYQAKVLSPEAAVADYAHFLQAGNQVLGAA